jgi:hypothetical protein
MGKIYQEKVICLVDTLSYFRLHQKSIEILLLLVHLELPTIHVSTLLDAHLQAYPAAIYAQLRSDSSNTSFVRHVLGQDRSPCALHGPNIVRPRIKYQYG